MHILGSTIWYNYLKGQLAIYTNILDLPNLRAKKSTFKNPYRYKHINAQTHLCVKRCCSIMYNNNRPLNSSIGINSESSTKLWWGWDLNPGRLTLCLHMEGFITVN